MKNLGPYELVLTEQEFVEYTQFLYYLDNSVNESIIPGFIKNKIDFIKELATIVKSEFDDIVDIFKDTRVYKFFQLIGWNIKKLFDLVKKGFTITNKAATILSEWAERKGITKWTDEALKELDLFISTHPYLKSVTGIAVAGILAYIWFNMTFTGDPSYDFDMKDMLAALSGNFVLSDIFGGKNGFKLLMLFTTGSILSLSFPWPGPSSTQFIGAVLTSVARSVRARVTL